LLAPQSYLFVTDQVTVSLCTLSLHDALPIYLRVHVRIDGEDAARGHQQRVAVGRRFRDGVGTDIAARAAAVLDHHRLAPHLAERSEEHTSELQSRVNLVCRLLLEK